jgi:hypothetical protein
MQKKKWITGSLLGVLCIDAIVLILWVRPFVRHFASPHDFAQPDEAQEFLVSVVALLVWAVGWCALYQVESQEVGFRELRTSKTFKYWSISNAVFAFILTLVIVIVRGEDFLF